MLYKNITRRFFGLVTKHACNGRTDRRTDGQNYDSQDRASIARAVKTVAIVVHVCDSDGQVLQTKFVVQCY